jgi:hypothetical protein
MTRLEVVARALAKASGYDPEAVFHERPTWFWWTAKASAVLEELDRWAEDKQEGVINDQVV